MIIASCTQYIPPLAAVSILILQYCSYTFYHLAPQWQKRHAEPTFLANVVLFHFLTVMIVLSFVLVSVTNPGDIPSTSNWMHFDATDKLESVEIKKTGAMRHCKWCGKNKPDRCHHCRKCNKCVLKMDHHCPYILNCVGFHNYKYFFVLIVYSAATSAFMAVTMYPTMRTAYESLSPLSSRVVVIYGWGMSVILSCAITPFVVFHATLMSRNMTTIEYCERTTQYRGAKEVDYDIGMIANIMSSLGPWYCWCVPRSFVEGAGLSFPYNESRALLKKRSRRAGSVACNVAFGTSKDNVSILQW